MPDKILNSFIDPKWIDQLNDKNENLAEIIDVTPKTITNYKTKKNNPKKDHRDVISKEYGITFDSIRIKDLILMLTHISDKILSSNCKRVLLLFLLSDGVPGAEIEVEQLKEEGHTYGYCEKEIDEAIKKLVSKGIVEHKNDKVNLVFSGIKNVYEEYRNSIKEKEEKKKKRSF